MEKVEELKDIDKMKIGKSNPDAIKVLQKLFYNCFDQEYENLTSKLLDGEIVGETLVKMFNMCDRSVDLFKIILEKEPVNKIVARINDNIPWTFDELIEELSK